MVLSSRRVLTWLLVAIGGLTLANCAMLFCVHVLGRDVVFGMVRLFYLDGESNVPTWYSSMQLLVAAGLLWGIGSATRERGERYGRQWQWLGVVFVLLSAEEISQFHESVMYLTGPLERGPGILFFWWVMPGAIFAAVLGFIYLRFLLALPGRTRWLIVISAGIFLSGAIGMELVGSSLAAKHGLAATKMLSFAVAATVEEVLEMVGIAMFIYALAAYMEEKGMELRLRFLARR